MHGEKGGQGVKGVRERLLVNSAMTKVGGVVSYNGTNMGFQSEPVV